MSSRKVKDSATVLSRFLNSRSPACRWRLFALREHDAAHLITYLRSAGGAGVAGAVALADDCYGPSARLTDRAP